MTVWKYEIDPDFSTVMLPVGAKPLCVQLQNDIPQMWVLVDEDAALEKRDFVILATGEMVDESVIGAYVGTFQVDRLVFHLFQRSNKFDRMHA
jgi:hypothetical protein